MSVTEAGFKVPTFGHETARLNGEINKSINEKKKILEFLFLILNFSNLFRIFEVEFEIDHML